MTTDVSLTQAGLLALVALAVGLIMGLSLPAQQDIAPASADGPVVGDYNLSVQGTAVRMTAAGLPQGIIVVTYGRNTSYGRIATAQVRRDGSAVVGLDGLEQGTEYRYAVSVVTSEGQRRPGTTGSFTTTGPVEGRPAGRPDDGINASSNPGAAGLAFDDDPETDWEPEASRDRPGTEPTAYMTFDYAQRQDIAGFGVWTRASSGNGSMRFLLYVDGEEFGPYTVDDDSEMQYFSLETVGTTFRLGILDRSDGTGIREFELRSVDELE